MNILYFRNTRLLIAMMFVTISMFFVSCDKDDDEMEVPSIKPEISITTSLSELKFGYFEDAKSFYIKNNGNILLDWKINNSNEYLTITPISKSLEAGDSTLVTVNLNRSNLDSQVYVTQFSVENDNLQDIIISTVVNHYEEEKWLLDGRIIDSEFDKNNDLIIAVSESPDEIRKYDPVTKSVESLKLNLPPTSVSVSKDGNFAAVGHNGSFSYVNLSTMKLDTYYPVTANVFDIVLAPNNWVYVFPKEDQWERIRCIELSTGVETSHSGYSIFDSTKAKLHPSGSYIYGANNGLFPSDFEKYDITDGTATYMYDSPYHGDYDFDGDIWVSEDGSRLFAKSRRVFNSYNDKSNDMTYNGELVGEGKVMTLDHSSKAGRVYAIFSTSEFDNISPTNEVRKYNSEFLAFQGVIKLPEFLIPDGQGDGTIYDSKGYFGFFNALGTKYYVLVKIQEGSGAEKEWAIATIDVD